MQKWNKKQLALLKKDYGDIHISELQKKINDVGPPRTLDAIRSKGTQLGVVLDRRSKIFGVTEFAKELKIHYSTVRNWMLELKVIPPKGKIAIPVEDFERVMNLLRTKLPKDSSEGVMSLKQAADRLGYAPSIFVREVACLFPGTSGYPRDKRVSQDAFDALKKKLETKSLNQIISESREDYKERHAKYKRSYRMDAIAKFIEVVAPLHESKGFDRRALAVDAMIAKTVINKNVSTYYVVRSNATFFVPKDKYNDQHTEEAFRPKAGDIVALIHSHSVMLIGR